MPKTRRRKPESKPLPTMKKMELFFDVRNLRYASPLLVFNFNEAQDWVENPYIQPALRGSGVLAENEALALASMHRVQFDKVAPDVRPFFFLSGTSPARSTKRGPCRHTACLC